MLNNVLILSEANAVAEEAARRFVEIAREDRARPFSVALSGGSTPQRFYRRLTESPYREQIAWHSLQLFFADERFVPANDAESNFRMVRETLLDHVPLADTNVHAAPTTAATPEDCARLYARTIRAFFGDVPPRFDLIILGMGPDGHTASLFPGRKLIADDWVIAVLDAPKPPPTRISFTLDLINQAHQILFLVTGKDKAEALASIHKAGEFDDRLPAGKVKPIAGSLTWLVDQDAARLLCKGSPSTCR